MVEKAREYCFHDGESRALGSGEKKKTDWHGGLQRVYQSPLTSDEFWGKWQVVEWFKKWEKVCDQLQQT
jgi:hypothetical protein